MTPTIDSRSSVHPPEQGSTTELDRQLATLVSAGYPAMAGLSVDEFTSLVEPLRGPALAAEADTAATGSGHVPFLLAVRPGLVPTTPAVEALRLGARTGFTTMEADDLARFRPTPEVDVPDAPVYLVTDVDTGAETLNVRPEDALPGILESGRSPLTIEEGVALVTQRPEVLREQNSFEMLGSRCGDRRVTGLWVSKGRPRLGWCWFAAPHTWLGMATCADRVA